MRDIILCTLLIILPLATWSQNGYSPYAGARGAGMANTYLSFQDVHAAYGNASGLAEVSTFSAVMSAHQRFGLSELQEVSLAIALPVTSGTFGLSARQYGFELYKELGFGLAYGRRISDNLNIGAQGHYLQTNIPEYGNTQHLTFDIGFQARLFESILLSGMVFNPLTLEKAQGEKIPTVFRLGTAYRPSDRVLLQVEIEKEDDLPVSVQAGLEYSFLDQVFFRVGGGAQPANASFGLGYAFVNGFFIDAAATWQPSLGFVPVAGMGYRRPLSE